MDLREQHIKEIIRDKVTNNDNPYLKCMIIDNQDLELNNKTKEDIERICNSLMNELGFRFKLEFQPECCFLKARKIPDNNAFLQLREKNAQARFNI